MRSVLLVGLLGCTSPYGYTGAPPPAANLRPITLDMDLFDDTVSTVELRVTGLLPYEELSIAHSSDGLGATCTTPFDGGCVDLLDDAGGLITLQSRLQADADGQLTIPAEQARDGWYQAIAFRAGQTAISNPVYREMDECPPGMTGANAFFPLVDGHKAHQFYLCNGERFSIEVPVRHLVVASASDGVAGPIIDMSSAWSPPHAGHRLNDRDLPQDATIAVLGHPDSTLMSYDIQADLVPYRPCQPSPKIATTTVPPTYEGSLCTTEVAQHRVERMAGENTWVRVDGEHSSIWAQVKVRGVWQDLPAIGMLVVSEGTIETRIGAGPITSDLLENLSLSYRHQVLGEDMCSDDLLDNHTPADAATLPASGELCGEPDWFEIDAPAGDRVTLDLSGDTSAQMTVVDADGNTLTAGQQHLQFVAPAGGAWLRLDASDGHEPWGTPYSVTVHHEPWSFCIEDRNEPNDGLGTFMVDGIPVAGAACDDDVDRYDLFVEDDAPRVVLRPELGDRFDLVVEMDGELLADLDPDPHVFKAAQPAPGWWQAVVRPVHIQRHGSYLIDTERGCLPDSFEPNDPAMLGAPGSSGRWLGTLCEGDHDQYRTYVARGESLQATLEIDAPALFRISQGATILSQSNGSGMLTWTTTTQGWFIVDVIHTTDEASYTVDIDVMDPIAGPCLDDGVRRLDAEHASHLELGARATAVSCPGEDDWFRVEWPLNMTGEWIVRPTDEGVVDVHLYDASGQFLTTCSDILAANPAPVPRWVASAAEQVSFIRVEHKVSDLERPGVRVEVEARALETCSVDPWEPNDSLSEARALPGEVDAWACMNDWDVYTIDVGLHDELSLDIRGRTLYSLDTNFAPLEYRIEMDGEVLVGPRLARVSEPDCLFCTDWAGVVVDAPDFGTMSVWIRAMEGAAYTPGQPYTVDMSVLECPPEARVPWTDPSTPLIISDAHTPLEGFLCGSTSHHFEVDGAVGDRIVVEPHWNSRVVATVTEPDGTSYTENYINNTLDIDIEVVEDGPHRIELSRLLAYRNYTDVTIHHLDACEPDAYEPDEPFLLAPDAVGIQQRTVCPDDRDYLALSLDAGETADIWVTVPDGEGGVQLDLVDTSGQVQRLLTVTDGTRFSRVSTPTPIDSYLVLTMTSESFETGEHVGSSAVIEVEVY